MNLRPEAKVEIKMFSLYTKMKELLPHVNIPPFTPRCNQSSSALPFKSQR